MSLIVDITPSSVHFLYNNKMHRIKEIMEGNGGLMITTEIIEEEKHDDLILEPNNN